jgi:hypothetical protein
MKKLDRIITESIDNLLNEGIDFDPMTRTVAFNPSHEDNVDTSLENNPTVDNEIVQGVNVWSIFKRKRGNALDGNPLVYALKNEGGWHFRSKEDYDAIERQFNLIASKFARMYPIEVTIIIPSGNELNNRIAEVVMSKSENAQLIQGVICKMTTEEVNDIVMEMGSKFREYYGEEFNAAYYQLLAYLEEMNEKRNGTFSRHFVKDPDMRNILDMTLKVSEDRYAEFANKINGQNILLIDDTISRGQTIQNAYKIITDSYAPKSVTVLTLLSKLS